MKAREFRFRWNGEIICVVVAGDVLALPDERWSQGGFGRTISVEWILHESRLPGPKGRKQILAECLVRALHAAHEADPAFSDEPPHPTGPCVRCKTCEGSGFVPASREA